MPPNVGLYYDELFLGHETFTHPENVQRVLACMDLLDRSGLARRLERPASRDATDDELARVHTKRHIEAMHRIGADGPIYVLADTIASQGTPAAAVRAAGSVVAATEAVVAGDLDAAFCLTRPPGHHAVPEHAMGFCFFNSVAVAAAHARAALGLERVAIVDFDLHHGNGTQDIFNADPAVLYVSTHQFPFYPGTGHRRESGKGEGRGATLNLPLPGGCGDDEYRRLFDEVIIPKLRAFRPQLLLVSAGYDAHYLDPMGGAEMRISSAGYAHLVTRLRDAAGELCDGRIVLTLEGGYDYTQLAWSVRNSIEALLSEPATPDGLVEPSPLDLDLEALIAAVKELHGLP